MRNFMLQRSIPRLARYTVMLFMVLIVSSFVPAVQANQIQWFDQAPTSICRAASRKAIRDNPKFVTAFPTMEYLENGINTSWGIVQIPSSVGFTKDVPEADLVAELGKPIRSYRALVQAANRYAVSVGSAAGRPTCETIINQKGQRVWGVVFFRQGTLQVDHVTKHNLEVRSGLALTGSGSDLTGWNWFRAANRYADTFKPAGFATGFITGEWTTTSTGVTTYDVVKFRGGTIVWRDAILGIQPDECEDGCKEPVLIDRNS